MFGWYERYPEDAARKAELGWRAEDAGDDFSGTELRFPQRVIAGWAGLETAHRCQECGLEGGH